jgi:tetratricopeptide (TPR) repeat protein
MWWPPGWCWLPGGGPTDDGLDFIGKARALGEVLHQPELVSYTLNADGLALVDLGRDGMGTLEQALRIALDADLQDAAGRAYSSLQEAASRRNLFAQAERYYAEGMAYCEECELGVYSICLQGWRAVTLAQLGRWDEAANISTQMLDRHLVDVPPT